MYQSPPLFLASNGCDTGIRKRFDRAFIRRNPFTFHLFRNTLGALRPLERKVGRGPLTRKRQARMANRQRDSGDDNHGTFQDHIRDFLIRKRPVEALAQFRDPEAGPDEYGEGGNTEC